MRKSLAILTVLMLAAMVGVASAGEKQIRLGLALQTIQNPFYLTLKAGAEKAAAELGNVQVISVGAEHSVDLTTQVKQIEDFIQMKVDVIGVVAIERKGIIPTIEKANRAGIPVITVDTDADGGKREAYIATDNVLGGRLGAEWIIKMLDGKGKIAVLEGAPGSQVNDLRLQGFREAMKKAEGVRVVSSLAANWRRDTGMNVMNDILTAQPDIQAVMALNDEMALGAMEAIKARGKSKQVLLVGYNGAAEAIQQVYKGAMAADVVQYPERIGDLFVRWSLRILKGEKPAKFHIDSGVNVVDTVLMQKVVPAALQGR
ncbi:MAG TPA: sugar ABC transporter substrate-binding protein [Candidatus Sulfotelmatobacter sp.]|nr:sugar ABC transporter substrate-binding protein [Candidatus Sulfotelmatobacter sp.]